MSKYVEVTYNVFGGNGCPLRKREMPMYVTYGDLFELGTLIVAIIGLVYEICQNCRKGKKKDKK